MLNAISKPLLIAITPIVLTIILSLFLNNDDDKQEKINNQVLICNEQQLRDQLEHEKSLRLNAEELAESLRVQLNDALGRQAENEEYIEGLLKRLNELNLEDDGVSPRTKEMLRQLNERTIKALVESE